MTPYEHARHYASLGWKVFPCRERGKEPACAGGCLSAVDSSGFDTLFAGHARDNYGIATGGASGIWVLDIDGPQGVADFQMLKKKFGPLAETYTVQTGSGGYHLFFRMPSCGDVRNTQKLLGLNIDIRGTGGYVVGPGSIHPNGTEYIVVCDAEPAHATWLYMLMATEHKSAPAKRQPAQRRQTRAVCNSEIYAVMPGYYK